jgi:hypothetical protein
LEKELKNAQHQLKITEIELLKYRRQDRQAQQVVERYSIAYSAW